MKMNMRIIFLLTALLLFNSQFLHAQVKDSLPKQTSPVVPKKPAVRTNPRDSIINKRKADSLWKIRTDRKKAHIIDSIINKKSTDSLARLTAVTKVTDSITTSRISKPAIAHQQIAPTIVSLKDSMLTDSLSQVALTDTIPVTTIKAYQTNTSYKLLLQNRFINIKQAPVYFLQLERKQNGKEILFYSICLLILFVGLFKTFYYGYFNNLFRVFFNTSLRQSQLTDQLVQAKLPSFILNILFVLSAGLYAWLLFTHYSPKRLVSTHFLLPVCIGLIGLIYLVKYLIIKFMGWVGGIQSTANNYIFVIFLVNKIIGILLIPFIILLAFSNSSWIGISTTISFLLLGLFFLARYVKSYGSLDHKLRLNAFHFIIYVIGAEILPLMILYKIAVDYVL